MPLCVKRLNNGLAGGHETDFVTNRECGLETMILDAESTALRRHFIPSAQYLAEALPAFWLNRLTVPSQTRYVLSNEMTVRVAPWSKSF